MNNADSPQGQELDHLEADTLAPRSAESTAIPPALETSEEQATQLLPPDMLSQTPGIESNTWVQGEQQGNVLGPYHRVVHEGIWRFGELYHAEHSQLHRRVLLIVLAPQWTAIPEIKSWFLETANSVGCIQDPNLSASILEYGVHEETLYIATPLPGESDEEFYRKRVFQAFFPKATDPICDAFIALIRGLKAMHDAGISHGAIKSGNLLLSDTAQGVRFLPFACGLPQAIWVDLDKRVPRQSVNAMALDYQALALEFIRVLLGHRSLAMPARPTLGWFRRKLPFVSPKLATLLVQISRSGLKPKYVDLTLKKLDVLRYEILIKVTASSRVYHVFYEMFIGLILLFCVPFAGLYLGYLVTSTAELRQINQHVPLLMLFTMFLPSILYLGIYLLWEPIFNTTIARASLRCQLIDIFDRKPNLWRRFARSFVRLGTWALFAFALWFCLIATKAFEYSPSISLTLTYLIPLIAIGLVYATSIWFGGVPIHDWLSGTRWVQFKRSDDGHSIAISDNQDAGRTLLNASSISADKPNHEESIGDVRLQQKLGQGGMGTVYLGFDHVLNRHVAVKVTMPGEHESRESFERFRREAKLGANLDHPNITKVYRVGMWGNQPFIEMEYVEGETFQQIVKRDGSISVQQAWNWILQAAIGLREAALQGVVHRDIKPSNLMLSRDGLVKIMDFGISKSLNEEPQTNCSEVSSPNDSESLVEPWLSDVLDLEKNDSTQDFKGQAFAPWMKDTLEANPSLTRTGSLLGTPQYMSPEQAQCGTVDNRSDIYSLGLTLYYLLAGRPAFEGPSMYDLLMRQCSEPPPPLDNRLLGDKQREVLDRMIAKRPEDRFQDYQQLIDALQATQAAEDRVPGRTRRMNSSLMDIVVLSSFYIAAFCSFSANVALGIWIALSAVYLFGVPLLIGGLLSHRFYRLEVQNRKGGDANSIRLSIRHMIKFGPYLAALGCLSFFIRVDRYSHNMEPIGEILFCLYGSLANLTLYWTFSYYFVATWNRHRRAIHDLLAGTRIVYRPSMSVIKNQRSAVPSESTVSAITETVVLPPSDHE